MHFRKAGIPAYGYSPILMNITDEARRHGNDERVFLRDYLDGIEIMDQVVKEYAFFPPGHKASAAGGAGSDNPRHLRSATDLRKLLIQSIYLRRRPGSLLASASGDL